MKVSWISLLIRMTSKAKFSHSAILHFFQGSGEIIRKIFLFAYKLPVGSINFGTDSCRVTFHIIKLNRELRWDAGRHNETVRLVLSAFHQNALLLFVCSTQFCCNSQSDGWQEVYPCRFFYARFSLVSMMFGCKSFA